MSASENSLVKLLREYARPEAANFGLGLVALLLARIPQRAPAFVIGVAFDAVLLSDRAYSLPLVPDAWVPSGQIAQLWLTAGVLAAAFVAQNGLDWLSSWFQNRGNVAMSHDLRTDAYDAATDLRMSYYDDSQTGDVMSVIHNDTENFGGVIGAVYSATSRVSQVVVAFALMALLNWQLALVLATIPVFVALASRVYARMLEPRHEAVRETVGELNARLEDSLNGVRTVKAFTREEFERERVADISAKYRTKNWETIRLRLGFDFVTWMSNNVFGKVVFLLGGYWVIAGPPAFFSGTFTAGALLTFMLYSRGFLEPVKDLAVDTIDAYEDALASSKRIDGLLSHPARRAGSREGDELDVTEGHVEFDNVTFTYEGAEEPAVERVSFTAEPGELVGVVGSTGAGKSTLVKLLFRFYEPDSGAIRIDGQDIRDVSLRSLRRQLGYVSQDPQLFDGTIAENIAYATEDRFDTDDPADGIVRAATLAGAHEFVAQLPEGYDTEVGERGVKLSGGQRQRVAIARALLRDPKVLVLDEATSHVDNETEVQIQRSLESMAGERTTFAIAHRLSTVRDADRTLVVDDGTVAAEGTHEELLERDGLYADLWKVQVGDIDAVSEEFVEANR
ncbi:ABC transporter [Halosimplex carlsbadense 2-9-1]|uniref:ABC transporter n=1 Tax=Halosimplex carlsbadense 2-9-1 TaxID=797114 RepID=M0D6B4_9EURY|nr:ABC transporter ATP-binding protein [Halosimplex carlsbadense]ELZ30237.1 ABC transporter [Halosimplex carlsbadense 2-9-1]